MLFTNVSPDSDNSANKERDRIIFDPTSVKHIGVFHLNGLGDFIFSLPPLLAVRKFFPHARITSIIRPNLTELLEPLHLVDKILERSERGSIAGKLRFLFKLRRCRFDLAILFSQSGSASIFARLSGAKLRVGFIDTIFPSLLSHPIDLTGITCTKKLLYLVECLGVTPVKTDYTGMLKISADSTRRAEEILAESGLQSRKFAILSFGQGPGPVPQYKTWTLEHFADVGSALLQLGITPVLVGGGEEITEAERIVQLIGKGAVSLVGKTNLSELCAVIEKAQLLIGIDSGPMHVAAALKIPVIALFGPTDPAVTGPDGNRRIILRKEMPCAPCRIPTCEDRCCITAITPKEVMEAAEKLLNG